MTRHLHCLDMYVHMNRNNSSNKHPHRCLCNHPYRCLCTHHNTSSNTFQNKNHYKNLYNLP